MSVTGPRAAATQLLQNLAPSSKLQDLDLIARGPAGAQETSHIAAAAEGLGLPIGHMFPMGAEGRGWREFIYGGPSAKIQNSIYSAPTIEELRKAAQINPRLDALTQLFRAYTQPYAQGQSIPPKESGD